MVLTITANRGGPYPAYRSVAHMTQTTASYATLCAAFQAFAKKNPNAVIIRSVGGTTEITWREWDRRVRKLAAGQGIAQRR